MLTAVGAENANNAFRINRMQEIWAIPGCRSI